MTRTALHLFVLLLALGAAACGGSDDENKGKNAATGGSGTHTSEGACGEISEACHPVDDGSDDLAAECHHVAHENETSACESRLDECVTFCQAKAQQGEGGAGGANP